MNTSILIADRLFMEFETPAGKLEVINDISFQVQTGEFICIIGPNGCGKSTLINILGGYLKPSSGFVSVNGKPVIAPSPEYPVILQDLMLFYWMTAIENLVFGLKVKNMPAGDIEAVAGKWIQKLGLGGFEKHYPFELSGGMKQKLAIARALILNPHILLMDEPFANLDIHTREDLQQEISELASFLKMTVLMVTHSIDEAVFLADKVLIFSEQPSTIKEIIRIPYARPRESCFKIKKEFFEVKNHILNILHSNEGDKRNKWIV